MTAVVGVRMTAQRTFAWLFVLGFVMVLACGPPPLGPGVVAQIDGDDVAYETFERYLEQMLGETGDELDGRVLSALFDDFLREEVLLRRAAEEGIAREGASRVVVVAQLARRFVTVEADEDALRAYYEGHQELFEQPERVRLRQILVDDESAAEAALTELEEGQDFVEVARRHSIDPSANEGGDQGELGREDLPEHFVDIVFGLEIGELSGIVAADYGFHLFQVLERKPPEVEAFGAVQDQIRSLLLAEQSETVLSDLLEEGWQRYNVRVGAQNLPFAYHDADEDSQ